MVRECTGCVPEKSRDSAYVRQNNNLRIFFVEIAPTALVEIFCLFEIIVSLFFVEKLRRISSSYFACQIYSIPILG